MPTGKCIQAHKVVFCLYITQNMPTNPCWARWFTHATILNRKFSSSRTKYTSLACTTNSSVSCWLLPPDTDFPGAEISAWYMGINIWALSLLCQSTASVLWGCSCTFAGRLKPISGIANTVTEEIWQKLHLTWRSFSNIYPVPVHFVLSVGWEKLKVI